MVADRRKRYLRGLMRDDDAVTLRESVSSINTDDDEVFRDNLRRAEAISLMEVGKAAQVRPSTCRPAQDTPHPANPPPPSPATLHVVRLA